ncbi:MULTISPECIES: glucose dehydrogenase [Corynebacterium]|uniref:glucose dehydrogenase n=1 Tax=Corynebacterium TaxID=1716 RepID=UPI00114D19B1|nr:MULTISPECIES: glucose dehydrogenase [Corynebacterium]MCG7438106.1 glucose dehydrogenase [Corynebacterium freneyi]
MGRNRMGRAVAVAAAAVMALTTSACMDDSPATQTPFEARESEPTGLPMPDSGMRDAMPAPGVQREPRGSDDPCAIDDVVLAACLPEVTAMASPGPGRAVVATADGRLHLVVAGAEPVEIADAGSRVAQITAGPTVAEDGQLFLLRADGSVARLTLLPGGGTDLRELPEHGDAMTLGLYLDEDGEVNTLLAGDPGIEVISMCHGPHGAPPLMTVRLDGTPMLAQWSGGLIEPVGGVDLDDSLGGCAVVGPDVVVAVPGAQRVVSIPITPPEPGPFGAWTVAGSPTTLLEGEFGHVGWVAPVVAEDGVEVWGGTVNTAEGRSGGTSDERVFRIPSGGSSGGSPD